MIVPKDVPLIAARIWPRLSSRSMAFRFVGSLCVFVCACLRCLLVFTHTPHGHNVSYVDTLFGSEKIIQYVSLLGKVLVLYNCFQGFGCLKKTVPLELNTVNTQL